MKYIPMHRKTAEEIIQWKYESPYDFYNMEINEESINELLKNSYYSIWDDNGILVGFFCIGSSAQVPIGERSHVYGGNYIDIGIGMKPELTGKRNGADFLHYVLAVIRNDFSKAPFRLTVATFNNRAIHLYENAGFFIQNEFKRKDMAFMTMIKD